MSTVEQRLHDAMTGAAGAPTSPDLFDRVRRSIDADRRRSTELRWRVVRLVAAATAAALTTLPFSRIDDGRLVMPWWVLEVLTTALLVAVALWLGPFIKRFGRAYAADVFHDNPLTGKSYIVLTDIVYYLIFTAYILFTVRFEPAFGWGDTVSAGQVKEEVVKVGGILLVIGVLHGLNIVLMPVLGRMFSLNRRLPQASPVLRRVPDADRDEGESS